MESEVKLSPPRGRPLKSSMTTLENISNLVRFGSVSAQSGPFHAASGGSCGVGWGRGERDLEKKHHYAGGSSIEGEGSEIFLERRRILRRVFPRGS